LVWNSFVLTHPPIRFSIRLSVSSSAYPFLHPFIRFLIR